MNYDQVEAICGAIDRLTAAMQEQTKIAIENYARLRANADRMMVVQEEINARDAAWKKRIEDLEGAPEKDK